MEIQSGVTRQDDSLGPGTVIHFVCDYLSVTNLNVTHSFSDLYVITKLSLPLSIYYGEILQCLLTFLNRVSVNNHFR